MVRKRMTADQRRESIIKATIKVIARLNYDRATTALIAKEAGVNEALIYNHFKSKQELQLAALDYLIEYKLKTYQSNPAFQKKNKGQSIVSSLNAQYLEDIRSPEVDLFACFMKAFFAIDSKIREKAWECILIFNEFNRQNMEKDMERGILNDNFDPEILVWGMLGATMVSSTLAINDKLDDNRFNSINKLHKYYEKLFIKDKTTT